MTVLGEEPALEIMGVFLWRGTDIIHPMVEHPQFEYFNKRKLDVTKEEDRNLVIDFWVHTEEQNIQGLKCQTRKLYKWYNLAKHSFTLLP